MDLEKRRIAIRPRSQWEACDLGIQMGRTWWWPLVKIQTILALPWALICWLMPEGYTLLPVALFWLGKPLWERFLLHYLSLAIFDNQPTLRQVVTTRQILTLDWFASITWRRLSPWRSYHSAITVLEKQKGRSRRQRLQHLNCDHATAAAMVTLLLFCMEWAALISLWIIAFALMPNEWTDQFLGLKDLLGTRTFTSIATSFYFLVNIAVTPFYVAAGFALYLNRRVWLEAWDIDINFKAIAARLGHTALLVLCSLIWQVHQATPAVAQSAADSQALHYLKDQDQIGRAIRNLNYPERLFPELTPRQEVFARYPSEQWRIQDIFASADFHQKKMQLTHKLRWEFAPRKAHDLSGWQNFFDQAARFLEIILWCLVILLIFWLAVNYRALSMRFRIHNKNILTHKTPENVFGLDIRPQSLPEAVDELALNYCQNGQMRQGLSLLYRATLVALVNKGLVIKASHTEEDCLNLIKNGRLDLAGEHIAFFHQLTHHWQGLAYGHQLPPLQQVEHLCRNWRTLWQVGEQDG